MSESFRHLKTPFTYTHRDQRVVSALLPGRPAPSVRQLRAAAAGPSLPRRVRARRRGLPVLVRALGLGLQTALVQGIGLLPTHLMPLPGRAFIALLAAGVMPPEELDPPPQPLHHRVVPRHHEIRHHPRL